MSTCLEVLSACLDSECISLNPLALFKAFYLNIHADLLEKLAFLLPYFYKACLIWKGGCVLFPSFTPDGEEESFDCRMGRLLVVVSAATTTGSAENGVNLGY